MKKLLFYLALFVSAISFSQVGIGTINPNVFAALEVTSTTRGFLPPRVTYDERNAINSPPAGLIIWCSNCGSSGETQVYNGTTWTNISGTTAGFGKPTAPTNPVAIPDNEKASVAFTAPASNGGSAVTGYTVTSSPGDKIATGTVSPIVVTGLTNGTSYTFTVVATNAVGNSVASTSSTAVTPSPTIPDAPTSPIATRGHTQASVAFTAPASNGGSAITGYTVTSTPGSFTATGTSSPIIVTGLTNGTSYTFTVVATNAVGNSVASTASTAVTPIAIPGTPTNPIATRFRAQASVAFSAPAPNGSSAITGYTVTATASIGNLTATGTSSPIVFTNLISGITYTFTVVATNTTGNSVASAASAAITTDCGAFVATGSWKVFSCYNLGVTNTSLNPNTPVKDIHGDYYQWGRNAPAATVDAIISTWGSQGGTSNNGNWASTKQTNDPCPTGFRVPSKTEWDGVKNSTLNTVSRTGTWTNDGNFTTAISFGPSSTAKTLTIPAAGSRTVVDGTLAARGNVCYYWTSTESSTNASMVFFNSTTVNSGTAGRSTGNSVRCISE